jgi:ABC-2 type transport system permease protein
VLLAQLAFTIGLALLIATLTVYFRDLEHLIGIGMTGLFYLTPVLYPLDASAVGRVGGAGRLIPFLQLNPLSWFLESYHALLYRGTMPHPRDFSLMLVASVVVLLLGYAVFLRLRARLPEEV